MALQFEHPTIAGVTLGGWMNRADAQPKIAQARPPAPERRVAGARRLVGVDAASRQDRAAPRSGRGAPRVDAPGALLLPALSCVVGQLRVSLDRNLRPLWRCTPVWRCTYKSASPECACGRSGCEGALLRGGAVRHGTHRSRNSGGGRRRRPSRCRSRRARPRARSTPWRRWRSTTMPSLRGLRTAARRALPGRVPPACVPFGPSQARRFWQGEVEKGVLHNVGQHFACLALPCRSLVVTGGEGRCCAAAPAHDAALSLQDRTRVPANDLPPPRRVVAGCVPYLTLPSKPVAHKCACRSVAARLRAACAAPRRCTTRRPS